METNATPPKTGVLSVDKRQVGGVAQAPNAGTPTQTRSRQYRWGCGTRNYAVAGPRGQELRRLVRNLVYKKITRTQLWPPQGIQEWRIG